MNFRDVTAPHSTITLPEISFGAASLGNLYRPMSDDQAAAILNSAISSGLHYIDTAPHYGHGLSERRVGNLIRGRDDMILSTKVGRLLRPNASLGCASGQAPETREGFASPLPFERVIDYSYDGIMRSFEDSQQRLGLATIDILYIHDIGERAHGEAHTQYFAQLTTEGGLRALEELRSARAIKAFGVGANEWQVCEQVMDHVDLDVVLLAGRYTLLEQTALNSFLPLCEARNVSVIVGGVYNSGILATGTRHDRPLHYDYGTPPPHILAHVQQLEEVCDTYHVPLPAAALAFALAHPAVASVLVGLSSPDQVTQTLSLYHHAIPHDFWADLKSQRLLPANAPVPSA